MFNYQISFKIYSLKGIYIICVEMLLFLLQIIQVNVCFQWFFIALNLDPANSRHVPIFGKFMSRLTCGSGN